MNNKILVGFGIVILLAVGAWLGSLIGDTSENLPIADNSNTVVSQQAIGASVAYIEGAVEYRQQNGDWTRMNAGQELREGDQVETLEGGKVIINLDDGSVLRLNSNSHVSLTSMDPNRIEITNESGDVYSRVAALDRVFQVHAGGVVYESLGTAYRTKNTQKEKGVEVYHSKVKVVDGSDDAVVVDEGQMFFVTHEDSALEKAIADIPEEKLAKDDFITWNKEQDATSFKAELGVFEDKEVDENEEDSIKNEEGSIEKDDVVSAPAQEKTVQAGIVLTYIKSGKVSWTNSGVAENGYKVVWSKNANPVYPTRAGDKAQYYSDPDTQYGYVSKFDGAGMYYIRVCEYTGDGCVNYSNQVTATFLADEVEKKEDSASSSLDVKAISLLVDGQYVKWSVNGEASHGFKVTWSKNPNPTYPARSGDTAVYISKATASKQYIKPFDGSGTYYVRVCAYNGNGACSIYSNQVSLKIEK